MTLVALDGTPLVIVGGALRQGTPVTANASNAAIIDAANEACIMHGQISWADGGTHIVDTSGSSSLGWRTGTTTFVNAGTTVKVGLASVDASNGPPARASNASDVISFDVSRSIVGGSGGIPSGAWHEHVPDAGTKTITHGDLLAFCVQATARAGADSVIVQCVAQAGGATIRPGVTTFTGGSYINATALPNVVITAADGTLGWFVGGYLQTTQAAQTWNNTSGTKEYGNYFMLPAPVRIYGLIGNIAATADLDLILYTDPLGTPAAARTHSIDSNQVALATSGVAFGLFSSPYDLSSRTPAAGIVKPTTASNVSANYKTLNAAVHQAVDVLGENCYAINRNTGAFSAQNANKDRFAIGLLVGAFENPARPRLTLGI